MSFNTSMDYMSLKFAVPYRLDSQRRTNDVILRWKTGKPVSGGMVDKGAVQYERRWK